MKLFAIKEFRCYFVFLFFILIGNNEIQAKEVEATIRSYLTQISVWKMVLRAL